MKKKLQPNIGRQERNCQELSGEEMKMIVGSGNNNLHTIPPELFEALFVNPARMK